METITAFEAAASHPAASRWWSRRPHATTMVAALYVALVLGAPGIVRFAPEMDARWLSAVTTARPQIQCASVAAAPSPCAGFTMAAAGSAAPVH